MSFHPYLSLFFFLFTRRPQRSTPFPTRRSSDLEFPLIAEGFRLLLTETEDGVPPDDRLRSEEHTSELQSLTNLVCRLLLEKKNRGHNVRQSRRKALPLRPVTRFAV